MESEERPRSTEGWKGTMGGFMVVRGKGNDDRGGDITKYEHDLYGGFVFLFKNAVWTTWSGGTLNTRPREAKRAGG